MISKRRKTLWTSKFKFKILNFKLLVQKFKFTLSNISSALVEGEAVAQCNGSLPSLSLISGLAPFNRSSSTNDTDPTTAALCNAVEPLIAYEK